MRFVFLPDSLGLALVLVHRLALGVRDGLALLLVRLQQDCLIFNQTRQLVNNAKIKVEQYCAKGRIDLTCEQTSSSTVVQESYNTSVYKNVVEYYLAAVATHLTFWVPVSTICVGEGGIEGTLREGNINDKIIAI